MNKRARTLTGATERRAEAERPGARPIVALGASAGGLDGFEKFFAHLPASSGMAFVAVQHLDPHHETILPELLHKFSKLPTEQVRDQTQVQPDHVYVIPPNSEMTIEAGILRVSTPAPRPGFPINRFFESLAEDQGSNAVCVLLSGSGTDGTLGLRAVKEHGGMTIAQSPETTHYDSMVRSAIATGMVDHILPSEAIAPRLVEHAAYLRDETRRRPAPDQSFDATLARICEVVRRKSGHDFSGYKKSTLVRRIERRMQVDRSPSMEAYLDRIRTDGKELDLLFRDLLIGVTQFFRDPDAFEVLEREVITRIVGSERAEDTIRVWTPGCATGEEAYSVAMLLREALDRGEIYPKVQIFAGDIDEESLELARTGRYPEAISQQMTPDRLARFFEKQGSYYQISKGIREMVVFSRHSLIKDPPFSRLHLVVCRNVLIYLEAGLQRHAIALFHYALRPGGFLFLGPSESVIGPPELFRTIDKKHRIFQRSETLPRRAPTIGNHRAGPGDQLALLPAANTEVRPFPRPPSGPLQRIERMLLEDYAPAWVLINGASEALYFSTSTGKYLEHASGAPSADILTLARKGLRVPLRTAIHGALKTNAPVVQLGTAVNRNGEAHRVDIIVRPIADDTGPPSLFLVLFRDLPRVGNEVESRRRPGAGEAVTEQLENELRATREHLQATIEEVETSNEELKSSNEELQSANEELQATNEELQTSKEELQSVNEELETINVELSKKAEELDGAHSDLQNLFQSTRIAILFLDRSLRIKRFTDTATEVFRLIPSDVGRRITDIAARLPSEEIIEEAKEVLKTLVPRERKMTSADRDLTFLVRILPYRRLDDLIDGVVLTFTDITQVEHAQRRIALLASIVESTHDAIVCRDLESRINVWNQGAASLLGYAEHEAVGKSMSLIVPADRRAELEDLDSRIVKGEELEPIETVRVARGGRRIPVLATVSPLRDEQGRVVGISSALRDITEIARAREGFREEGRRKDEFLAMLSHELRNPLAPLRTALAIAREESVPADQKERALEIMERQTGRLSSIVDQLLSASRISTGRIVLRHELVDLAELARLTAEDYRPILEPAGVRLVIAAGSEPLWIEGDPNRLGQAVANLLNNAAKFTGRGEVVTVETAAEDGAARLTVRDTGAGIEPSSMPRLFAPFVSIKLDDRQSRGGLGLGLWLVKALVEAHGGTVEARSEGRDHGFEVEMRIPLYRGAPEEYSSATSAAAEAGPISKRRVLLVEDNPDAAEAMRMLLAHDGHDLRVAVDGEDALAQAREFEPEVVICDIGLPGRLDGFGVAEAIRADPKLASTRLIALTGMGREEDRQRALRVGFDRHLTKPADPKALRRMLAE